MIQIPRVKIFQYKRFWIRSSLECVGVSVKKQISKIPKFNASLNLIYKSSYLIQILVIVLS